jgi:hypothetical protein
VVRHERQEAASNSPANVTCWSGNPAPVFGGSVEAEAYMKHEQRIVGHVSGRQEYMDTCVCGAAWPCAAMSGSETDKAPEAITQGTPILPLLKAIHTNTGWLLVDATDDVDRYVAGVGSGIGPKQLTFEQTKERAELMACACNAYPTLQSSLERTERELREAQERVIELDTERMAARAEHRAAIASAKGEK